MVDYAEYKGKIEAAEKEAYLFDRLEGLGAVKQDLEKHAKKHERERNNSNQWEAGKAWMLTGGLTSAFCIAAGINVGGADGVGIALLGTLASVMVMGLGSAIYGDTNYAKAKGKANYDRKHGDDMGTLRSLQAEAEQAVNGQVDSFRQMTSGQKAGVVKLEDLVEKYPDIRRATIQAFVTEADLEAEQPSFARPIAREHIVAPQPQAPANGPTGYQPE